MLIGIIILGILITISFPIYKYFNTQKEEKDELRELDEERR